MASDQPDNDPHPHGQLLQMDRRTRGTGLRLDVDGECLAAAHHIGLSVTGLATVQDDRFVGSFQLQAILAPSA